jgi:phage FluMu protein Com
MKEYYFEDQKGKLCIVCNKGIFVLTERASANIKCSNCGTITKRYIPVSKNTTEIVRLKDESSIRS